MYYDPLLNLNHTQLTAGNLIMWGFFLLPNDQAMAQRFYELALRNCLVEEADGTAHIAPAPGRTRDDIVTTTLTLSLANELGDTATVQKLRAHAEARYEPTWDRETGEFYYLFGKKEPYPRGQLNANIMVSEAAGAGAWSRLFSRPNLKKYEEPTVCGVNYPEMGLSRAYYDRNKRTLALVTYPVTQSVIGKPTSFRIRHLAQPANCTILADNVPYGLWSVRDGELEISTTVARRAFRIIDG